MNDLTDKLPENEDAPSADKKVYVAPSIEEGGNLPSASAGVFTPGLLEASSF